MEAMTRRSDRNVLLTVGSTLTTHRASKVEAQGKMAGSRTLRDPMAHDSKYFLKLKSHSGKSHISGKIIDVPHEPGKEASDGDNVEFRS